MQRRTGNLRFRGGECQYRHLYYDMRDAFLDMHPANFTWRLISGFAMLDDDACMEDEEWQYDYGAPLHLETATPKSRERFLKSHTELKGYLRPTRVKVAKPEPTITPRPSKLKRSRQTPPRRPSPKDSEVPHPDGWFYHAKLGWLWLPNVADVTAVAEALADCNLNPEDVKRALTPQSAPARSAPRLQPPR